MSQFLNKRTITIILGIIVALLIALSSGYTLPNLGKVQNNETNVEKFTLHTLERLITKTKIK